MRSFSYIVFTFFIAISSANTQSLSNTHFQLVLKRTADWCSKCGEFGWDIFNGIEKAYKDQPVLVLAVHSSGNLRTPTSLAITENYGGFGQPIFYVNGIEAFWPSNVAQEGIDTIKSMIGRGISNQANFLSMGTSIVRTGESSYRLDATIKLNASIFNSRYQIAHYLVNDHKVAYQENQGAEAIHTGYLSNSLTGAPFGDVLINGSLEKDKSISQTLEAISIDIPANELKDHRVVSVVWKLNPRGKFDFIEARSLSLNDVKVSVEENTFLNELDIRAYQSEDHVILDSNKTITDIKNLKVLDGMGRILQSTFNFKSNQSLIVDLPNHTSGIYYISLFTSSGRKTIPVFLSGS